MLNIIYYVNSASGDSPIKKDLKKIKKEAIKAKIKALIIHVAQNDSKTSYIITKNIRSYHFSEIRIKFSKNLYRVLYFIWKNNNLILLHIFLKKEGQATPNKELVKAENRYQDFIKNTNLYE